MSTSITRSSASVVSMSRRREMEDMVRRVEHCRLETHPQFFDFFVDGCQFRRVEATQEVAG